MAGMRNSTASSWSSWCLETVKDVAGEDVHGYVEWAMDYAGIKKKSKVGFSLSHSLTLSLSLSLSSSLFSASC
jgi:hypothetical protein